MCSKVTCRKCAKASWSGCGQHVDQVMRGHRGSTAPTRTPMANTRRSTQRASTLAPTSRCCDDHWNARGWMLSDVSNPEFIGMKSVKLGD